MQTHNTYEIVSYVFFSYILHKIHIYTHTNSTSNKQTNEKEKSRVKTERKRVLLNVKCVWWGCMQSCCSHWYNLPLVRNILTSVLFKVCVIDVHHQPACYRLLYACKFKFTKIIEIIYVLYFIQHLLRIHTAIIIINYK